MAVSPPPAAPVIDAVGLCRTYTLGSEDIHALDVVDLRVDPGEFVAIMGPSGSGKSTLLHILGLMDSPDEGVYRLTDYDVDDLAPAQRSRLRADLIGFVFQSFHLVEHRRVIDNVSLPLVYQQVPKRQRRARAEEVLEWVGLSHRIRAFPTTLSGGERQRVAVARALVHEPRLLLCDEPTGSLDTANGERVIELLRRTTERGIAVVVVTHDPAVASHADRTVVLQDGQIQTAPR